MKKLTNIFNIKSAINRKIAAFILFIFLGIIIGFVSNKLTNNKLSDFFTLSVLYFKNSERIKFDDMLLKVPFNYTRRKDKNSLMLLKFPKGGGVIFFKKDHYLSKAKFDEEFKSALYKMHFNPINEGEIRIDREKGYFITASKQSNPSDYRECITIPNKRITISFIGDKNDSESFWEIVKQVQFTSEK